jgi:hypothetical protein
MSHKTEEHVLSVEGETVIERDMEGNFISEKVRCPSSFEAVHY